MCLKVQSDKVWLWPGFWKIFICPVWMTLTFSPQVFFKDVSAACVIISRACLLCHIKCSELFRSLLCIQEQEVLSLLPNFTWQIAKYSTLHDNLKDKGGICCWFEMSLFPASHTLTRHILLDLWGPNPQTCPCDLVRVLLKHPHKTQMFTQE